MYAVTYEADELPLCPEVRGACITFTGEIDLDVSHDGSWTVGVVWVQTAIQPPVGLRPVIGRERLYPSNPIYKLVEAAARAFDRRTGLISIHVADELEEIVPAVRRAAARSHLPQAAE